MTDPDIQRPPADRWLARIRQNRVVAAVIVVATIVVGVASFTDATTKLLATIRRPSPATARTTLGQMALPFTADAFVASAGAGDATAVDLYLQAGMDPKSVDANDATALEAATARGHAGVVDRLLRDGVPIVGDDGRHSALISAVAGHQDGLLKSLLDRHPGQTAIDAAFLAAVFRRPGGVGRNLPAMRMLAAAGAAVRATAPKLFEQAWYNADDTEVVEVVGLLIDLGATLADFDRADGTSATRTPLMDASAQGFTATARLLVERGARVDTRYVHPGDDDDGATALMLAAGSGSTEIVALLLTRGADANLRDAAGHRAIDHALAGGGSAGGAPDVVRLLQRAPHATLGPAPDRRVVEAVRWRDAGAAVDRALSGEC